MNLLFWGLTAGVLGKILVAVAILRVHYVMAIEKSIDGIVINSFSFEKILTLTGILLIIFGYLLEIYFYNGINILTCELGACSQAGSIIFSQ